MPDKLVHQRLLIFGCLLWFASFFGELFGQQPYSTLGIVVSPFLTFAGFVYWLRYYRATRGHYPTFRMVFRNIRQMKFKLRIGLNFSRNHLFAFWVFCTVSMMFMVFTARFVVGSYASFKTIEQHCATAPEISDVAGKFYYISLLVDAKEQQSEDSPTAKYGFTLVGSKGSFDVTATLRQVKGLWRVETIELR